MPHSPSTKEDEQLKTPLHRAIASECTSANAAVRTAEQLSRVAGNVGAVAFSRTGDPAMGEFTDAVVLKAFGDVPSELSEL